MKVWVGKNFYFEGRVGWALWFERKAQAVWQGRGGHLLGDPELSVVAVEDLWA